MAQAVRIDPAKLIEIAEVLAEHRTGAGRPRTVWLRRAVSSAYYALFHCLTLEAGKCLIPNGSATQQLSMTRAFGHREVKDCCGWIAGRATCSRPAVLPLVKALTSTPLVGVADSFCDLQEARHRADYDHLASFSKAVAVAHIEDARSAIADVAAAAEPDRQGFFSLLALRTRAA